jgi:hypothetical protein
MRVPVPQKETEIAFIGAVGMIVMLLDLQYAFAVPQMIRAIATLVRY